MSVSVSVSGILELKGSEDRIGDGDLCLVVWFGLV